jgi:hypothetical protein
MITASLVSKMGCTIYYMRCWCFKNLAGVWGICKEGSQGASFGLWVISPCPDLPESSRKGIFKLLCEDGSKGESTHFVSNDLIKLVNKRNTTWIILLLIKMDHSPQKLIIMTTSGRSLQFISKTIYLDILLCSKLGILSCYLQYLVTFVKHLFCSET